MFQLFSHKALYDDKTATKSTKYAQRDDKGNFLQRHFPHGQAPSTPPSVPAAAPSSITSGNAAELESQTVAEEDEVEHPQLSLWLTASLLLSVTVVGLLSL